MLPLLLAAFISVDAPLPCGTNGVCDTAAFVKTFECAKAPVRAVWTVSGLGVFRVYVNGREIGAEDFLKPGLTHVEKRRHSFAYDVAGVLKTGGNVLSAEVSAGWWRDRTVRHPGWELNKESGFHGELELVYGDGAVERIGTDESWQAAYTGRVVHANTFWGETYDARVGEDWRETGNVDWRKAKICGEFSGVVTPVEGQTIKIRRDLTLKPRKIYVWRGAEGAGDGAFGKVKVLRRYAPGDRVILEPGETLVVDFAQNAAGIPEFTASASAGVALQGHPAEMLNDCNGENSRGNDGPAGSAYIANYRTARTIMTYVFDGEKEVTYHPSYTFFGGRYFSFTANGRVEFSSLRFLPVMSIAKEDETGRIETGHDGVNRLISNCVWGMRSNYLSVPTDCPQRNERLGWAGDTQVFCGAAVYAADVYGFLTKWMTDMRDSQMGEGDQFPGSFRRVAPVGFAGYRGYMIGWSDAGVIVPHTLWRHFGDTRVVKDNWEAMERFMDLLRKTCYSTPFSEEQCADWLSAERYERWRIDRGSGLRPGETRSDMRAYWEMLGSCFHIQDIRMMREMASAIGDEAAVNKYGKDEKRMTERFRKTFLEIDGRLPVRYRDMQTPSAYLLRLGLYPNEAARAEAKADLRRNLEQSSFQIKTGFLGTPILLDVLADELDDSRLAYSVLLQRKLPGWLYSVDQGATTIWEHWDGYTRERGFGRPSMNSFNHYAYGAVLGWMYRTMAGIRPGRNGGFREFTLAPRPDRRIGCCKASYRTRHGVIESSWMYGNDGLWHWTFSIPEGVKVTAVAPDGKTAEYGCGEYELALSLQY